MSVLVLLLSVYLLNFVENKNIYHHDICANSSRHRIYLEFDEVGVLEAKNLTTELFNNETIQQECVLEIVSCPSCVIFVNFSFVNLSQDCDRSKILEKVCLCEYIQISEHSYEEFSTRKFCNEGKNVFSFKTLTKNVIIKFIYMFKNDHYFTADFKSQRNRLFLTDEIKTKRNKSKNVLLSPYFPSFYLNDLSTEYIISCPNTLADCRVRLIFTDFQIATMSIMEFFDWNGQRLDVVTGIHFRPPIILSNGPSLVARFYANGGTGLGFKAEYFFISDQAGENQTEFLTDCGGYVDNLGGAITMMNMVESGRKSYYCYWIVKPPKNYLHFKTHIYLKISNFSEMEGNTEVIVRQGSTSAGNILEVLRSPNREFYPINPREHIQQIDTGFYVSLRGVFGTKSRLAIVYTAFSYKDCFSGTDFLCENHRCIPRQLTCDGFDHCGDGSDEPALCYRADSNPEPIDRRWYSHTPNYFFPKIDPYSDLKTATLVFIVSSLGLISLVSALFVLLYRINTRAQHDRDLQNHLQIITDLLEEEVLDSDSITDEPPVYEAPPDYDEVIKVDCESVNCDRLKPRRPRRKKKKNIFIKPITDLENKEIADCLNTSGYSSSQYHNTVIDQQGTSSLPPQYEVLNSNNIEPVSSCSSTVNEVKSSKALQRKRPLSYISDKGISSNVRDMFKRKWYSHGEINNVNHELENLTNNQKIRRNLVVAKIENLKLHIRETASDTELLNFDSDDEYNRDENGVSTGNRLFDYFKRKTNCQCEGACGCALEYHHINKNNRRRTKKKVIRNNQRAKFYTR